MAKPSAMTVPWDFAGTMRSVAPGARSNSPSLRHVPILCAWSAVNSTFFPSETISNAVEDPGLPPQLYGTRPMSPYRPFSFTGSG